MRPIKQIHDMLVTCSDKNRIFPPTILYNEGWMLRLVVDWFARNKVKDHPLAFSENAQWYSEALLPSTFFPKKKGDKYGESWTHADGVIGNIKIGNNGVCDLGILPDATHLVVLEAKMFSKLSTGVTNAPYYNQAARNVACITEVLKRGNRKPSEFSHLGFYVIAPQSQINEGIFKKYLTHESIKETVQRRVNEYDEPKEKEQWYENWFLPTIEHIDIKAISWEELIQTIFESDTLAGNELKAFYDSCLKFNYKYPTA